MGHQREAFTAAAGAAPAAPRPDAWAAPAHLVLLVARQRPPPRQLIDCLAQRGLRCIWVDGLAELARTIDQVVPDGIVFDAQAQGQPLAQALPLLRHRFGGALLALDASHDEVDEILALELGADGLLPQPVSPRRLRARLEALLRRHGVDAAAPHQPDPGLPGGWALDAVRNALHRGAQRVELTAGQVQLLQCLARHAGRVVPRAELHAQVCAPESDLRARSIDVYVHRLRQRLSAAGVTDLQIDAVRGRGFALRAGIGPLPLTAATRHAAAAYLNSTLTPT